MPEHTASSARSYKVAWGVFAATIAVTLAAAGLAVLDRSVQPLFPSALGLLIPLGYALIGTLIATRQGENVIGWLFLGVGFTLALTAGLAQNYAIYTLVVNRDRLPAGQVALWLESPAFDSLFFLMMILLLALFPNGQPLTRRWRFAVWLTVIGSILGLSQAFQTFNIDPPLQASHNPFKASGAVAAVLDWAGAASAPLLLVGLLASFASVVLRFRRSRGVERQQLRWFAAAVALMLTTVIAVIAIYAVSGRSYDTAIFIVWVTVPPVATGIAILRYRLYEIDVIIRKTLIYAALAATLALVYLGGISLTTWVFRSVTGQSGALAVTLSTLAVAAAFQPLRTRIQRAVDHRFYRGKYDATKTLEQFNNHLRQQIDLDALHTEVLGVVAETLQPSHTTLWLRPAKPKRP